MSVFVVPLNCRVGVRVVITDGQAHTVDSNDISFQLAMQYAIRDGVKAGKPQILEPVMNLEVDIPSEFQGTIIGGENFVLSAEFFYLHVLCNPIL